MDRADAEGAASHHVAAMIFHDGRCGNLRRAAGGLIHQDFERLLGNKFALFGGEALAGILLAFHVSDQAAANEQVGGGHALLHITPGVVAQIQYELPCANAPQVLDFSGDLLGFPLGQGNHLHISNAGLNDARLNLRHVKYLAL